MSAGRRVMRVALALVATVAGLAVLAAASAVSLPWHGAHTAALRLTWSAHPERIEVCRALSKAEVEALGEHMRQRVECDGRSATYALRVRVDGVLLGDEVIRGGGLRHDRPLHLLQTYALSPGLRRIQVEFSRRERVSVDSASGALAVAPEADTGIFAGRAARETSERGRRTRAAVPPLLTLDTVLTFAPQQVILLTFDPDLRRLVVRVVLVAAHALRTRDHQETQREGADDQPVDESRRSAGVLGGTASRSSLGTCCSQSRGFYHSDATISAEPMMESAMPSGRMR